MAQPVYSKYGGSIIPQGGDPGYTLGPPASPSPVKETLLPGTASNITGKLATPDQYYVNQPISTGKPPISPTTVTNANIMESVIPKLNQQTTEAAQSRGQQGVIDNGIQKARDESGTYKGIDNNDYYNYDNSPVGGSSTLIEGTNFTTTGDPMTDSYVKQLNDLMSKTDAATAQQIAAIHANFENRRNMQKDISERQAKSLGATLLAGGSTRYAPLSSENIVSEQERFGVNQLADLDAQEQSLIAAAQQAQQTQNYKVLSDIMDRVESVRKEKQATVEKTLAAQAADNQKLQQQQIQASRDSAIGGLIGQGITDPSQILNYLNFYDDGTSTGGDFTADEVAKTLKNLTVDQQSADKLPGDIQTFQWLQQNGRLPAAIQKLPPSQQYIAYLNLQHLANAGKLSEAGTMLADAGGTSNVKPGVGAANATEEQIIRMRLFAKLMNVLNKGQVSDSDATRINANIDSLRKAGMTEQEIMSQLAGFPADVQTPYNVPFINAIATNTDTLDQQQQVMGKVGQLLASGNNSGALAVVENQGMKNALKIDANNYMGSGTAETYTKKLDHLQTLLKNYWPATVGPISGTLQQISRKLKTDQAQEIQSAVSDMAAQFRKDIAGSAVTDNEAKFLEPLIASLSDKSGNFKIKLDAMQNRILNQYNSTRSIANLPEVGVREVLDKNARLKLYSGTDGLTKPQLQSADDFLNMDVEEYDPSMWSTAQ